MSVGGPGECMGGKCDRGWIAVRGGHVRSAAVAPGARGRLSRQMIKFAATRPFSNPDAAARKLVEIANDVEAVQDGRIFIERVNATFLKAGGSADDFRAGIERPSTSAGMAARKWDLCEVHRQRRCCLKGLDQPFLIRASTL